MVQNFTISLQSFDTQVQNLEKRQKELEDLEVKLHRREQTLLECEDRLAKREQEAEQRERELDGRAEELKSVEQLRDRINRVSSLARNKIRLNVGGCVFVTTRDTLAAERDSMLRAMFSEEFATQPDEDGEVFIDRNGRHFDIILDHLRHIDVSKEIAALDPISRHKLAQDVRFYQVQSLEHFFPEEFEMVMQLKSGDDGGDKPREEVPNRDVKWTDSGSNVVQYRINRALDWKTFLTNDFVDPRGSRHVEWNITVEECQPSGLLWDITIGVATRNHPSRDPSCDVLGFDTDQSWSIMFKTGQKLHDDHDTQYASFHGSAGDVITIVLPGDGTLSFKHNGRDLGTAFTNLSEMVCPAASSTRTSRLRIERIA